MTINELAALAGLTANDQIPAWDAEAAANGRTKKISAQNLANAIKALASLIATSDLDSTPTQNSTKAVQSGGVYTAVQQSIAPLAGITSAITGAIERNATATINNVSNAILFINRNSHVIYGISDGNKAVAFTAAQSNISVSVVDGVLSITNASNTCTYLLLKTAIV